MPVSLFPVVIPVLIFVALVYSALKGRKAFGATCIVVLALLTIIISVLTVPGTILKGQAIRGNPRAQYKYAKWCENQSDRINGVILWPSAPDVESGYNWLERAAKQDYPPALYALGVRLKYGDFVPKPFKWEGPDGNVFSQPKRGQPYIDRALKLGYKPLVEERIFYWQVFRNPGAKEKL